MQRLLSHAFSATDAPGGRLGPAAPERPPLPTPERVNRNLLTVLAVVMGVGVLAAVVFMPPSSPQPAAAPGGAPLADGAQPTFLDQPVPSAAAGATWKSGTREDISAAASRRRSPATEPYPPGLGMPGEEGAEEAFGAMPGALGAGEGDQMASAASAGSPRGLASSDTRLAAYEAALAAPLTSGSSASSADAPLATDEEMGRAAGALGTELGAGGWGGASRPAQPGAVDRPERALAWAAAAGPTVLRMSVEPSPGPYALQAGTMVPAVLITEISSDVPGEVLAQVSRDVYDSQREEALLIPRGSKLLGRYDNQATAGGDRLLVAWTRLIFPDGRSVTLPDLQGKDAAGAGGLRDQVDRHRGETLGTAALLSLIGAGAQLAQPAGGYGAYGNYPTQGQVMAGAAGQQMAQVTTEMLRRQLDVRPTIRIRQGTPFNVFLNRDVTFSGPYATAPGGER